MVPSSAGRARRGPHTLPASRWGAEGALFTNCQPSLRCIGSGRVGRLGDFLLGWEASSALASPLTPVKPVSSPRRQSQHDLPQRTGMKGAN